MTDHDGPLDSTDDDRWGDDTRSLDDSWQTETGAGYSPDKLYTRASDRNGSESVRKQTRFPMSVMARVTRVAKKRNVSDDDYIRNAVVHELKRDEARHPNDPVFRIPEEVLLLDEALQVEAQLKQWESLINDIDRVVGSLINAREFGLARNMIEQGIHRVSEQDHQFSTMADKFNHMIMKQRQSLAVQEYDHLSSVLRLDPAQVKND